MKKVYTLNKHEYVGILSMFVILLSYYLYTISGTQVLEWFFSKLSKAGIHAKFTIFGVDLGHFFLIILFGLVLLIFSILIKRKAQDSGFIKFKKEDFFLALFVLCMLFPIAAISRIVDPTFDTWYSLLEPRFLTLAGALSFLPIMVFSVFKEELIERSIIQSSLRPYGPFFAALFTCINFGFAHVFYFKGLFSQQIIVWHLIMIYITVFLGSFMIALLFEATRNVWLTMIVHLLYNWIFIFQTYWHLTNLGIELTFWGACLVAMILAWIKLKGEKAKIFSYFTKIERPRFRIVDVLFLFFFILGLPILLILYRAGIFN